MDCASSIEGEAQSPEPGDLAICFECFALLSYGEYLHLELADMTALRLIMPEVAQQMESMRDALVEAKKKRDGRSEYEKRCDKMFENARNWRATNPGREVLIQYNYPPTVCIIQVISQAIKLKVVTANDAGLDLIKCLGPWDCADEPTVNMVRMVLEHEGK